MMLADDVQAKTLGMVINGADRFADDAIRVINPATRTEIGRVPRGTLADLDEAVTAARKAFPAWRALPIAERQRMIAEIGAVMLANVEELAGMLTAEQGKPLSDAREEIGGTGLLFQAISTLSLPFTVIEDTAERRVEERHVPLGVVGAIAPWNFPIVLGMWKVAPALLAGNTVVLKPSPFTPMTTLRIAQLIRDVLPHGVLNTVTGDDEFGPWMTAHPGIDKISFTGSSATGRKVMQSAAATLKRVTLELGGNDAAIVLRDVDLDEVVPKIFWAAFRNSGQICIAVKRVYVDDEIYDAFRDRLVEYARSIKVGDGRLPDSQLGPIQNAQQYDRVLSIIEDCRQMGLAFATGHAPVDTDTGGYFVPVTIIDNPPEDSRIVQEEPFGPVLPLLRFKSIDDAITRANASCYGLGGSVWTRDEQQALSIAAQLECGTAWINEAQYLSPFQPFGGHKQSGIGVENGIAGLLEYTNIQVIVYKRPSSI